MTGMTEDHIENADTATPQMDSVGIILRLSLLMAFVAVLANFKVFTGGDTGAPLISLNLVSLSALASTFAWFRSRKAAARIDTKPLLNLTVTLLVIAAGTAVALLVR